MDNDRIVCPHCYADNEPGSCVCKKCGIPYELMGSVDPIQKDFLGRGYIIGEGIKGNVKPLIFWGMWILCGPSLLMCIYVVFDVVFGISHKSGIPMKSDAGGFVWALIFIPIQAILLYIVTKNYIKTKKRNIAIK